MEYLGEYMWDSVDDMPLYELFEDVFYPLYSDNGEYKVSYYIHVDGKGYDYKFTTVDITKFITIKEFCYKEYGFYEGDIIFYKNGDNLEIIKDIEVDGRSQPYVKDYINIYDLDGARYLDVDKCFSIAKYRDDIISEILD